MQRSMIASLIVLGLISSFRADVNRKAVEIFKGAAEAASKLSTVAYAASAYGEGELASAIAKVEGTVMAQRGPSDEQYKISITGTIQEPQSTESNAFAFSSDGQ